MSQAILKISSVFCECRTVMELQASVILALNSSTVELTSYAFFLTVAIGNCMVKIIPCVDLRSTADLVLIFIFVINH
jgi:hypothetical protein